ncbi:Glycosyltransferase involved in cell wall bisynthesis [Prevotella sp. tc2-28]|uniref:glycosyltransferase family 4 protein n=1 Tax=Prevotella sp. tc2-28 TaxID=1761888 RepID=UPI000898A49B|nr:glycosyltransferase family 4 protein [Prevotella sp. tc2-28]SEA16221.1 Glycosyltransferase involved in cell wall bisynthesis [Prevotella sp. tc2-28]
MKICILTPRFPMPECGGDLLRINYIARHLKSQGHQLVLVSYTEETPDIDAAQELYDKVYTVKRNKIASIFYSALFMLTGRPIQCGYYYSWAFNSLFKKIIQKEKPDLYISHLLRMVPFLENAKLQGKSIIEMTDALSKTYALATGAKGNNLLQNIYKIEKHLIAKYEKFVIRRYPKIVLVSLSDIDFLSSNMKGKYTEALELHTNGVEYLSETINHTDTKKICFIGHMQSLQNQDAVLHFVNDIFPLILAKKPDMKFYVVGAHPPKSILKLDNGKNIFVTGFVDDLNKFVADSCIAVAPVQIAAGIQNKVLVALANGIPVVLTSLIAKAIPELRDGENCFIRDDDLSFAEACLSLLEDINLRAKIREQGRHTVIEHYSWHSKLYGYELFDKH